MSLTMDARQSDLITHGSVLVIQPDPKRLHFICVGRKSPTPTECLDAIAQYITEVNKKKDA